MFEFEKRFLISNVQLCDLPVASRSSNLKLCGKEIGVFQKQNRVVETVQLISQYYTFHNKLLKSI